MNPPCHFNSPDKLEVIKLGRFWGKEALNRNSRVSLELFHSTLYGETENVFCKITASETSRASVLFENMYSLLGRNMAKLYDF